MMEFKSLFFLLLILTLAISGLQARCGDEPNPDSPCKLVTDANDYCKSCMYAVTEISRIPDPFDCHRFYYCQKTGFLLDPNPYTCPDGMHFDSSSLRCEQGSYCTPRCDEPGSGGCPYSCKGLDGDGLVADQFDCSAYHVCTSGTLGGKVQCPPGTPYFDGSQCQDDVKKCCHCRAFCKADQIGAIPDPVDCTKYHMCLHEGDPIADGQCPPGENFDATSASCSALAPCNTICKNVIGADGCIELFTCTEYGKFAKCPLSCSRQYYDCNTISNAYISYHYCFTYDLFHPDQHICVDEQECPYPHVPTS